MVERLLLIYFGREVVWIQVDGVGSAKILAAGVALCFVRFV
jgi:hypothetical protein